MKLPFKIVFCVALAHCTFGRKMRRLFSNSKLFDLSLVGCSITDDGLKHLTGLKRLKILALDRTGVTVHGVAKAQIALPDCEIRSDYSEQEINEAREALQKESK